MLILSTTRNWPQVGELDIMENVNAVNKLYGTLHCGVNPGGPCDVRISPIYSPYLKGFIRVQVLRPAMATLWPVPPYICTEILPRFFHS